MVPRKRDRLQGRLRTAFSAGKNTPSTACPSSLSKALISQKRRMGQQGAGRTAGPTERWTVTLCETQIRTPLSRTRTQQVPHAGESSAFPSQRPMMIEVLESGYGPGSSVGVVKNMGPLYANGHPIAIARPRGSGAPAARDHLKSQGKLV